MYLADLHYTFKCDWLIELPDNKLFSEFLNPITMEEIVISRIMIITMIKILMLITIIIMIIILVIMIMMIMIMKIATSKGRISLHNSLYTPYCLF